MSMDFTGREPQISPTDAEGVMFSATPAWERNRKRRGFGLGHRTSTVAPEPRSFAPSDSVLDAPLERPMDDLSTVTPSTLAADDALIAADEGLAVDAPPAAPISRTTTVRARHSSGASPAVIVAALGAVAVLGVGGWYAMSRHNDTTVLTPGTTTSEVAAAPITPADQPAGVGTAANTLPQPRAAAALRQMAAATPARVRPAHAASVATAGTNASATLPDGPQPYAVNPAAPPAPVTPAAPPTPSEAAPAVTSASPPIAPEATPAPATPAPTPAPDTTTPPTN
ncbi:hypothetical protein [Phenylobacterium sp.]|uniref:hypothetical protein n=1 Tax=Phenylobacterium sp. TaxID=1871053 RepID=UPI0025CDD352|nr:hypothetical protein [Phenylobacterium sp.]